MRIAVWHNLPSGGGKRALYTHILGLLERGHTVESWCPPTADQTYLPLGDIIPEHILPLDVPTAPRFPLRKFAPRYWSVPVALQAMDEHCRRCAADIARGGFDVLLGGSSARWAVTPIARRVKLPSVLYLQEPARHLYEAGPRPPWAAAPAGGRRTPLYLAKYLKDLIKVQGMRIQVREEVRNAQAYDTILVNSLFSRESIIRAYGLDSRVCYLGIDTEMFVAREQPREHFVIGIGSFTVPKNIELVIASLGLLPEPRPALVWVGNVADPEYLGRLKQAAESKGVKLDARVRITDEELVDLLNRAALMVYTPRLEPFGFAPIEANACGTPVVAVAEGGVRESVVDGVTGLLVEHDAKVVAAAIQRLLDDPVYARQLGRAGREIAATKWSRQAAAERLERKIEECLEAFEETLDGVAVPRPIKVRG